MLTFFGEDPCRREIFASLRFREQSDCLFTGYCSLIDLIIYFALTRVRDTIAAANYINFQRKMPH